MAVLAFAAGSMDVNAVYTLDGIEVSADRQKDRFGNMITEQSYYRTGGDVQVIDSDTIEKRHYTQVGDGIEVYSRRAGTDTRRLSGRRIRIYPDTFYCFH